MRKLRSRSVFFAWEKRTGVLGVLGRARLRLWLSGALAIVFLAAVYLREEKAAGVRATRATIAQIEGATRYFRADHEGSCPRGIEDLVARGYLRETPTDAWGHSLRFSCPGRKDSRGFDVVSDGPDGVPYGLDRVE